MKFLKFEIHVFLSSEDLYLITSFLGMDSQTYMKSFEKARIGPIQEPTAWCRFFLNLTSQVQSGRSKGVKLDGLELN